MPSTLMVSLFSLHKWACLAHYSYLRPPSAFAQAYKTDFNTLHFHRGRKFTLRSAFPPLGLLVFTSHSLSSLAITHIKVINNNGRGVLGSETADHRRVQDAVWRDSANQHLLSSVNLQLLCRLTNCLCTFSTCCSSLCKAILR